jgi:RNA polymerase sigma-70 factor (ECF subfamily)
MTDSSDRADPFESLLRPHLDQMYRLAFRLTGQRHDAEDLVQDTLVKLYRRRDELTSIRELRPWLGRVLFNQFIDDKRRYGRQALHLVDSNIEPDATAAPASARLEPDLASARGETMHTLARALERLSEEHRVVLLLHDVEGYKLVEIHELMGIPVGTVKSRLHRARARLREMLTPQGTLSEPSTCNATDGVRTDAV